MVPSAASAKIESQVHPPLGHLPVASSPVPVSLSLKKLSRKLLGTQYCALFTVVQWSHA